MKLVYLSHKIQLDPNNKQCTYFKKACGVSRFAYNWALAEWDRMYKAGEKVSEYVLDKRLNAIKREQFPWMIEVTKCAPQKAIMDLGDAFKRFFKSASGYPKYKKKGQRDSFYLTNESIRITEKKVRIPRLGWVRMTEPLRFQGKIMSATISRTADKWFISIQVEMPEPPPIHTSESQAVGIDLGIRNLATLSDGRKVAGVRPRKALASMIRRLNKSLSRKVGAKKGEKKSKNFIKTKAKLARLHARIANIRKDAMHKLTTELTRTYGVIGIECLDVQDMQKTRWTAQLLEDANFYEFRRQMEYKGRMTGALVVIADKDIPSSRMCSECGEVLDILPLSKIKWICPVCGTHHDRDVNAAINLKNLAVGSTVSACGECVQQGGSMKQEHN